MHYTSNLQNLNTSYARTLESESNIYNFLKSYNIDVFKIEPLPSDASKRLYFRIITKTDSFMLMDSSAELDSLAKFISIDQFLRSASLNAPKILSAKQDDGFLLLEDFGNNLFTQYIKSNPENETKLYEIATDLLSEIHKIEPPTFLKEYDNERLEMELQIFLDWYVKYNIKPDLFDAASAELLSIFQSLYPKIHSLKKVFVFKDYMADNLMWLPTNEGLKRVGLLDFQDALLGSPVYDLSSLLQDARRDVSEKLEQHCLDKLSPNNDFLDAYNIIALQKNLRIIGVFHRLNLKYGKPKYMDFIPRMWNYVGRNLKKEIVSEIDSWFKKYEISTT